MEAPQTRPSFSMDRTSFSKAAMSVSSSQGLTWRVTTDLATSSFLPEASFSAVLAALASWYLATRSALTRSASSSSCSSSDPKRSMSSSSSSAALAAGTEDPEALRELVPLGRLENSDLYEAMCLYHRAEWGLEEASGADMISVTSMKERMRMGSTYRRSRTRKPRHQRKLAGSYYPCQFSILSLQIGTKRERVEYDWVRGFGKGWCRQCIGAGS